MSLPARLVINTERNLVLLWMSTQEHEVQPVCHRFSRRWEALFLGLLLQAWCAGGAVSASELQAQTVLRGQSVPLNRPQLHRLLNNLRSFLSELPGEPLTLVSLPRKHTVGPWRLRAASEQVESTLVIEIDDQPLERGPESDYPGICAPGDTEALAHWLWQLLVADARAVEGALSEAIEVVENLCSRPMRAEARGLLLLRLCHWYRLKGENPAARRCAEEALALHAPADAGIAPLARMALTRIRYDENPAGVSEDLWWDSHQPPNELAPHGANTKTSPDWRTLSDWHNLRALLARRRMLALAKSNPLDSDHSIAALHETALRHFQAALYMTAWHRDWDRLQAVVANLAYHLQVALSLADHLQVRVDQVMRWHRLTMDYEDKLGAGRDSAWEYIFFGCFWLDHQQTLGADAQDPVAHNLQNTGPDQEEFYIKATQRLRECGDARQVAIGLTLYLRFVQEHLSDTKHQTRVRKRLARELIELLQSQPDRHLLDGLHQEGYTGYWPPALRSALGI